MGAGGARLAGGGGAERARRINERNAVYGESMAACDQLQCIGRASAERSRLTPHKAPLSTCQIEYVPVAVVLR